jgi:hypothetical protein
LYVLKCSRPFGGGTAYEYSAGDCAYAFIPPVTLTLAGGGKLLSGGYCNPCCAYDEVSVGENVPSRANGTGGA